MEHSKAKKKKKIFKKNEKVFDMNGNEYTIEEAIEKNIDLKL